MKILAIETSCDETAICLLEAVETAGGVDFRVLGNKTHTQIEHVEYGGVFPALAKREHIKNLPIILEEIMKNQDKPDYVCVTSGPGLEPALWTGIDFAKKLCTEWGVPVIPVNHMEGHILSVLVPTPQSLAEPRDSSPYKGEQSKFSFSNEIKFPALALLISGGHTELVLINSVGDYHIIGKTRDDAVGEAFDKVGRLLGLPYPGGPEISKLAESARVNNIDHRFDLPRPMLHTKDYDFSFSGLKTAVLYTVKDQTSHPTITEVFSLSDEVKQDIAREFENAVTDVLIKKTTKAVEEFGIKTLIIGGGVAANKHIIKSFKETLEKDFSETILLTPAREVTGDNALMIALAGYFKIKKDPDTVYDNIRAEGNLTL